MPTVYDYQSPKLCIGIKNMTDFTVNSKELITFFKGSIFENVNLKYECDTLITEGIPIILESQIAKIIINQEKISSEEAYESISKKKLLRQNFRLSTNCLKKSKIIDPEINIHYYYYPEYSLLITDVENILYEPGYSRGWLYLAELDDIGNIKIIDSSFWEE